MPKTTWTRTSNFDAVANTGASVFKAAGRWYAKTAQGEVKFGAQNRGWKTITEAKAEAL